MENRELNRTKLKNCITAAAAVIAFYGTLQLFGITCPIKFVTGVSCPGCGMTRSWLSLVFRQDLHAAFHYHPLFWIMIPAVPVFLLRDRLPRGFTRFCLAAALVLFFSVYAFRMLSPDHSIVCFRPREGLIGRILLRLAALLSPAGK